MIIDSHTHDKNALNAVISVSPGEFSPREGFVYSVGIHPWNTADFDESILLKLREAASHPQVVAIGEAGVDRLRGGGFDVQEQLFRLQAELSESVRKPLIIHEVKAADAVLRLRKELKPLQAWIRHGFRGNQEVAGMYLRHGVFLSFGERFNPDAVKATPDGMLLIETDESKLTIMEIAARIAAVRGVTADEIIKTASSNLLKCLTTGD